MDHKQLGVENESLYVTNEYIISHPMNSLRPKRSAEEIKNLSENKKLQYLCIYVHVDSYFKSWSVREAGDLQIYIRHILYGVQS